MKGWTSWLLVLGAFALLPTAHVHAQHRHGRARGAASASLGRAPIASASATHRAPTAVPSASASGSGLGSATTSPAIASPVAAAPARPDVASWAASSGRDCHVFHGRRMCEGPRRVPALEGAALQRAEGLGMVGPRVARLATSGPPPSEWVDAARAASPRGASSRELLWPVPEGRLWRGFGQRRGFRRTQRGLVRTQRRHMHEGVDIGAHQGSVIVAVRDGVVAYSDNRMSGYGNAVLVVHPDGAVSMYAHCVETYVVAGQQVRRGQVIAAVGQTGIAHGAHLHFEYRERGHTIDPYRRFVEIPHLPPLSSTRRGGREAEARLDESEEAESVETSVESVGEIEADADGEPPADTEHDAEP